MVLATEFAGQFERALSSLLALELIAVVEFDVANAFKTPHKVEVPIRTTEFAVGDDGVACGNLTCHEFADASVFHLTKFGIGDATCHPLGAGSLERFGTEKTANVVGAERRMELVDL